MKINELKKLITEGGLEKHSALYSDVSAQKDRFIKALCAFEKKYGSERDVFVLSVPGRSEIIGNHTDHNNGKVMAGAINRDIIAIAAKNNDNVIRFYSEGYPEDSISIADTATADKFRKFTSRALVAGMANAFVKGGHEVGGFDAYSTTEVLKGSGLSSSAAFEVMVGNILNHLYNGGAVDNKEIAKYAQYSENVYFGKPCGLMDQMACAVGGFVYIDFENPKNPTVEPIEFSLKDKGYSLCIVNTGGNHANLNADYASVPAEMRAAAAAMGRQVLRGAFEEEIIKNAEKIRKAAGDRAFLRAIHFVRENVRVEEAKGALLSGDLDGFFDTLIASGNSSFRYLQNVYTNQNPAEQGLSVALALTEGYLADKGGAFRVHGGGFAGTIQAFVANEDVAGFKATLDSAFGEGATTVLKVRPYGAIRIE